jgi:hypothetical protein
MQQNNTDSNLERGTNVTHPGDLEHQNINESRFPGDMSTKKEVGGWNALTLKKSELIKDDADGIIFQFFIYGIRIRKSGNDHLVPQIQKLLEAGTNKMDPETIDIDENAENLTIDIVDEKLYSSNEVFTYYNMPASFSGCVCSPNSCAVNRDKVQLSFGHRESSFSRSDPRENLHRVLFKFSPCI